MRQLPVENDSGFALVLVMWVTILLAAIGGALLHQVRAERTSLATQTTRLKARLIADGGINRVILSLINPRDSQRWQIDGTPRSIRLFDRDVVLQLASETGKIDLNGAPPGLLAAMFRSQGVAPAESEDLATRVVEWRTPLPSATLDAAANMYREAAMTYGPRHGLFRSVGELRLVIGMSDALQASLAPLVTVYSRSPGIDRGAAASGVLYILEESGDGLAGNQLRAREAGAAAGVNRPVASGEVLTVTARLTINSVIEERVAVVQLAGESHTPYRVLAWR